MRVETVYFENSLELLIIPSDDVYAFFPSDIWYVNLVAAADQGSVELVLEVVKKIIFEVELDTIY